MQELRHIVAFREVTRSGSFSEASRRLNVSPAAVSRSVAKLEEELGARLVSRTTRRLQLTDEGRAYLEIIGPAVDALHDAKSILYDKHNGAQGVVRVGLPSTFGRTQIFPVLNSFLNQHPGLEIQFVFSDGRQDLTARSLDLALQYGEPLDNSHLVKRLYVAPVVLVASPLYLAQQGVPRTPYDLLNHCCMPVRLVDSILFWPLVPTKGPQESVIVGPLQGRVGISDEFDMYYQAAKHGLGIISANLATIKNDLLAGDLKVVLPDYRVKVMPFPRSDELSIVTPHRNHIPFRTQVVKDFLIECAMKSMHGLLNPEEFAA